MRFPGLALALGALALAGAVHGQEGRLTVELNKLEEAENSGCRAYFLFRNETGLALEQFEMALAVFDTDGVIDRLLTIDAAPVPVARTTLKLFEIPDTACSAVSEVLLHDVSACKPQNAESIDCFPLLDLHSKAAARLVK